MIIELRKKWDGGGSDNVQIDHSEVDLSSATYSILAERVSREYGISRVNIPSLTLPRILDIPGTYGAFDAKIFRESDDNHYLYVLHAGTSGQVTTADLSNLYFCKYCFETGLTTSDVLVSSTNGVDYTQRVSINRFQSDGRAWASWVSATGAEALSSTSTGGAWSTPAIMFYHDKTYSYKEENDASLNLKKGGTWTRWPYAGKASGGYMLVSAKASSVGGTYWEFTFTGNEAWIYTYVTRKVYDSSAGVTYVGKIRIKIDGVVHRTIDLSKYDTAYQFPVKCNTKAISNGTHVVRVEHLTGKYCYFDAARTAAPSTIDRRFEGAIIRQSTGLDEREALVLVSQKKDKTSRTIKMFVDGSGDCSRWGTASIDQHTIRDVHKGTGSLNAVLHENTQGFWVALNTSETTNGGSRFDVLQYQGQTTTPAVYSEVNWLKKSQGVFKVAGVERFSMASTADGTMCMTVLNYQGSRASYSAFTPSFDFSGIDMPVGYGSNYTLSAVSIPGTMSNTEMGLLLFDNSYSQLMFGRMKLSSKSALISNVSDYISDLDISHSGDSTASSLRINLSEMQDYPPNHEASLFREILPQTAGDRDTRIITVAASFGGEGYPFHYETTLFTGILGEVSRSIQDSREIISIAAYGYGSHLQRFYAPYYLVYANPGLEWSEQASDYTMQLAFGGFNLEPLRPKDVYETKDDEGKVIDQVYYGWDTDKSVSISSIQVDPFAGNMVQGAAGHALSPSVGTADYTFSAAFEYDGTPDRDVQVGFSIDGWNENVAPHVTSGGYVLISPSRTSAEIHFVHGVKSYCAAKTPIWVTPNVQYRILGRVSGNTVHVSVGLKNSDTNLAEMYGTRPAGAKTNRRMSVGSPTSGVNISWDDMSLYGQTTSHDEFKYDQYVAEDLVAKAFQGIIPFRRSGNASRDYFTVLVAHPGSSFKDTLDRLAAQNGKTWGFDYQGGFMWSSYDYDDIEIVLGDEDLADMEISYDSSKFYNWVESIDSDTPPKTRVVVGDIQSILANGIRFKQVDSSEIETDEQARRVAFKEYYDEAQSLGEMSVTFGSPYFYIKPNMTVKVDSKFIRPVNDNLGYNKVYVVESVSLRLSKGSMTVSAVLLSRASALQSAAARLYDMTGIGDFYV